MLSGNEDGKFLSALADAGLSMHKSLTIVADGKLRRYRVADDKPGSTNGWYVLFQNMGVVAGSFGSWRTGEVHNWCSRDQNELSRAEKEALRLKYEELKRAREAEQERVWTAAAKKADYLWNLAKPAAAGAANVGTDDASTDVHQYLVTKSIKPFGVRRLKNGLVVAAGNAARKITTLQFIQPDGKKRFLTGDIPAAPTAADAPAHSADNPAKPSPSKSNSPPEPADNQTHTAPDPRCCRPADASTDHQTIPPASPNPPGRSPRSDIPPPSPAHPDSNPAPARADKNSR